VEGEEDLELAHLTGLHDPLRHYTKPPPGHLGDCAG
jgi:hypothetical protein